MRDIDEAIKHAEKLAEEHTQYNTYGGFESCDEYAKEYRQLANWLKELKVLMEQEQPHGEWIEKEDFNQDIYYDCSVCGNSWCTFDGTPWQNGMNFCPNCGADMRPKEGEAK